MNDMPTVALKEWAVIVDALASGDQTILLRKGGIEDRDGRFHLAAERFLLQPTFLHQSDDWLRDDQAHRLAASLAAQPDDDRVILRHLAQVASTHVVSRREQLDELAAEHVWSTSYLDMRWRYRPEIPLYLLVVRAGSLPEPVVLRETPAQRGCRSWVDLGPLPPMPVRWALDDEAFARRAEALTARLA